LTTERGITVNITHKSFKKIDEEKMVRTYTVTNGGKERKITQENEMIWGCSFGLNGAVGVTVLLPHFAVPQGANHQQGDQQQAAQ
jgi:hypothetical protein